MTASIHDFCWCGHRGDAHLPGFANIPAFGPCKVCGTTCQEFRLFLCVQVHKTKVNHATK